MIPASPPPTIDPLVEMLFEMVLRPPFGYVFEYHDNKLLYPVFAQDQWRLLLRQDNTTNLTPVFLEGDFIRKLGKALNAMQRELNKAVEFMPEDKDAGIAGSGMFQDN
jgi:hypothetical protein